MKRVGIPTLQSDDPAANDFAEAVKNTLDILTGQHVSVGRVNPLDPSAATTSDLIARVNLLMDRLQGSGPNGQSSLAANNNAISVAPPAPAPSPVPAPPPAPTPAPTPAPAPAPSSINSLLADGWFARILACYYPGWEAYRFPITSVPTSFNTIYVFGTKFNADGSVHFDWPGDVPLSQLQTVVNRGQRLILTVGGSDSRFNFANRTQTATFVSSVTALINGTFGGLIKGLDWNNFEGATSINTTEMIWASQQLRGTYGTDFAITAPPAPNSSVDQAAMQALNAAGVLNWVMPQYYDWAGFKDPGFISSLSGGSSTYGGVNRNKTWVDLLGATKVLVGVSANYNFSNALTLSEVTREWDRVIIDYPSERGLGIWNAFTDATTTVDSGENSMGSAEGGDLVGSTLRTRLNALYSASPAPSPSPAPAPATSEPVVATAAMPTAWLQTGNATDAYMVEDNRWGQGSITEGSGSTQFMQEVGRALAVGSNGEVAFRTRWSWPHPNDDVKAYPSIIRGRKPGMYGPDRKPAWEKDVLLPDGANTVSTRVPSGDTPGTNMPLSFPLSTLQSRFQYGHNISPTGQGHLVYDIWLQQNAAQDFGFASASITHEIMVPVCNWGGYGSHPSGRPAGWYDHDATIGGILWHVYACKNFGYNPVTGNWDGGSYPGVQYNFSAGGLNGAFTNEETGQGRIGWKFICFVPDMPLPADASGHVTIPLAALLNYVSTRNDERGIPWARGTEKVASVELGVEPIYGVGDITVWDYRVWGT